MTHPAWALAVHGGAPNVVTSQAAQLQKRRHEALMEALFAGEAVLKSGGDSLDAVQAAVRVLEDHPDFNAGRGAALTYEGHAELDASLMEGSSRRVGAIANVRSAKNPIDLARLVMDRSSHVFLVGEGADQFAADRGAVLESAEYFRTEWQISQLQKARAQGAGMAAQPEKSGTVGAVALDLLGNLAAGTSTGGLPGKRFGRAGDSAVIGAGTYAENAVCAVSCTGWGEYFIRHAAAHDLCARMKYAGQSLEDAAANVISEVKRAGGYGGLIAMDAKGSISMPFSTPTMARGYVIAGKPPVVAEL